MNETYIQENSWETVAKFWIKDLFLTSIPTVLCERLVWIREQAPEGNKIVDLGANMGHTFSNYDPKTITSVDIDVYGLPNFIKADITKPLPFLDNQFDIAVLGDVVEHTPNPDEVIKYAMRVAKKLIITVPWEHQWTSSLLPFTKSEVISEALGKSKIEIVRDKNPEVKEIYSGDNYEHLYHHQYFTPQTFAETIEKAGIKNYKIYEIRRDDWVWLGAVCV